MQICFKSFQQFYPLKNLKLKISMQNKLFKSLFIFFLFTTLIINAQDQIQLNSIKVNGITYNSSATVNLYKGVQATLTINYSIIKNTPTAQQSGNQVRFNSKTIAGPPHLIKYDNQSWPFTQYTSKTYEFIANISNTNELIENNNSGKLFLVYDYGSTNSTSNSININFIDFSVSNNTISGSIIANYQTAGSTIIGSDVSVPEGSYKFVWQRKPPGQYSNWYNIKNGTVNTRDYTPPAEENTYHYQLRRLVVPTSSQLQTSVSNEIDVRVRIGENYITENSDSSEFIGSFPKGGAKAFSFQWQENINGSWTNIPNATSINYPIPALSSNRIFRRIVTSPYVEESASNEITIKALRIKGNNIKLDYNQSYESENVLLGEKPIFNRFVTMHQNVVSTSGNPISFQWLSKTEGGNWSNISGATNELYTINNPLYETTHYKRIATSLNTEISESNIIIIPVSTNPKIENNKISFDPSNNDHILGTIPSGGNGNFTYRWVLDVHPDDSIGELIQWSIVNDTFTFLSEYLDYLPVISDEYRITRYAVSDNVWHRSNTLIYSQSSGIIQGRKAEQKQLELSKDKEVSAFVKNNELNFTFKNYQDTTAEIHIGSLSTGQSLKVNNLKVKNDVENYSWTFPSHYLPGIYVYRIIFSDGTVKSGKVIRK